MWLAEFFNGRYSPEEIKRVEERTATARYQEQAREMRSEYMGETISRAGRGVAGFVVRLGRAAKTRGLAVLEEMERRRRRVQAINELSALDDLALKDIGLVRGEIRSVVKDLEEGNGTRRTRSSAGTAPVARDGTAGGKSTERKADSAHWDRAA